MVASIEQLIGTMSWFSGRLYRAVNRGPCLGLVVASIEQLIGTMSCSSDQLFIKVMTLQVRVLVEGV